MHDRFSNSLRVVTVVAGVGLASAACTIVNSDKDQDGGAGGEGGEETGGSAGTSPAGSGGAAGGTAGSAGTATGGGGGSTAGSAGSAGTAADYTGVPCGATTCTDTYCCHDSAQCGQNPCEGGIVLQCDGPEDCTSGMACCVSLGPAGGGNSCSHDYECAESLIPMACHTAQDCPKGWVCVVDTMPPFEGSPTICQPGNAPVASTQFLSDDERNSLQQNGFMFYDGENPPDIMGDFLMDSLDITYDSTGGSTYVGIYLYTFFGQSQRFVNLKASWQEGDDTHGALGASITGTDSCFTVYASVRGASGPCNYRRTDVYSGCMSETGIVNFQFGFVMGQQSGDCSDHVPPGHQRVIGEMDGIAVKQ